MQQTAAIRTSRKEVGAAVPMASSKGGSRGVAARVGAGVGSGAATPRGGLEAEHTRGLGKSQCLCEAKAQSALA